MTLLEHAKMELALLEDKCKTDSDRTMQVVFDDSVYQVLDVFCKQQFSSKVAQQAEQAINVILKLLEYEPLTPLTGDESEWAEELKGVRGESEHIQQNVRYPAVFRKNRDNNTAFTVDGRLFTHDGIHWERNGGDKLSSHLPITFPYEVKPPQKVYLDDKNNIVKTIY